MKKRINLFLVLSGIIGLVLSSFMIHCFLNYVTLTGPYTESNTVVPLVKSSAMVTVFKWCCVSAVMLSVLIPIFAIPRVDLSGKTNNSVFQIFSSSLLGFLFGGYVVNFMITPLRGYWTSVKLPGVDLSSADKLIKIVFYLGVIAAIPCCVYFLMLAIQGEFKSCRKFSILSVFPVIWLSFRLVYYFMSTSSQVNAAGRKLYILSLFFALIFFLQDAKRWLDNGNSGMSKAEAYKHSRIYYISGFASIITLLTCHLSFTYLQAFWMLTPQDSYFLNAIYIVMALFIAFRIASVPQQDK